MGCLPCAALLLAADGPNLYQVQSRMKQTGAKKLCLCKGCDDSVKGADDMNSFNSDQTGDSDAWRNMNEFTGNEKDPGSSGSGSSSGSGTGEGINPKEILDIFGRVIGYAGQVGGFINQFIPHTDTSATPPTPGTPPTEKPKPFTVPPAFVPGPADKNPNDHIWELGLILLFALVVVIKTKKRKAS